MSTSAPPPAAAQRAAGQVPKAGLVSCAGKYEGRWEPTNGMAGMEVIFRSGHATIAEGLGSAMPFDCFTGGGKVVFYKAGSFTPFDYDFDIKRRYPADTADRDQENGELRRPIGFALCP